MKLNQKEFINAIRLATGSHGVWTPELELSLIEEFLKISDSKQYKCTDCGTDNFLKNNHKIRVGFCYQCEHPLWNDDITSEDIEDCELCSKECETKDMRQDEEGCWFCKKCISEALSKP